MNVPTKEAIELARKIVEIDIKRDEIWENLTMLAGDKAFELLRTIQNS